MTFAESVLIVDCSQADPGLLTLKAINAFRQAEVILYDHVAFRAVIDHGKGDRIPAWRLLPEELPDFIIDLARRYRKVVWAGDLSRWLSDAGVAATGYLRASGITLQVIPGVSSFQSYTVRAGIPLTRRSSNESFWIPAGPLHLPDVVLVARSTAVAVFPLEANNLQHAIRIFLDIRGDLEPAALVHSDGRMTGGTTRGILHSLQDCLSEKLPSGLLIIGKAVGSVSGKLVFGIR